MVKHIGEHIQQALLVFGQGTAPQTVRGGSKRCADEIDGLIEIIKEEREDIEYERNSNAHWKRIDCFKFFIGTLYNEMTLPTFDCGSRGEILVEGVDLTVDHEYHIDGDYDFDSIMQELEKMKEA